jgi:hypothetical protein
MDRLTKILNELLQLQSQLDAIIAFKTHASETTHNFFKQGRTMQNLFSAQKILEKVMLELREEFQDFETKQLKK